MDDGSVLIDLGLPAVLAVIMLGIGLTLTAADFRREAERPRGMIIGSVAQVLIMPLIGFGIASALSLDPVLAVGLVIVAACPGGATSNLIAYLGRANVALSIVMTVIATIVTIVTLPLFTEFALDWQLGRDAAVQVPLGRTIGLLFGVILLPVLGGMALRVRAPERAARLERAVSAFGAIVLLALIVGIALELGDDVPRFLRQAGPAAVLLNLAGISLGWLSGVVSGLGWRDRLTFAMELGTKNSTLGIILVGFFSRDFSFAVPAAAYGLLMYVTAAVLVMVGRRLHLTHVPSRPAGAEHGRS